MGKSLKITTVTCDPVTINVYTLPVKERRVYSQKEKGLFLSNPSFLPEVKYTPLPVYLFFYTSSSIQGKNRFFSEVVEL